MYRCQECLTETECLNNTQILMAYSQKCLADFFSRIRKLRTNTLICKIKAFLKVFQYILLCISTYWVPEAKHNAMYTQLLKDIGWMKN